MRHIPALDGHAMTTKRFYLYAFGIVLFGFLLRELFVLAAEVSSPFQGDSSVYMLYVKHLLNDGVFSMSGVPDAYRNPGYPLFVAAFVKVIGPSGWYHPVTQAQVLLGTASVALVIGLARQWLPRGWALLAGGLMATQPHSIAACAMLLSEVVLGFAILAALYGTSVAIKRRSVGWAVAGGVAFGAAFLVNPIVALFPPLLVFWRRREVVVVAMVALLFVGGWSLRNATIPNNHANDRAWINLVQGSWPIYHAAYNNRLRIPDAKVVADAIDAEAELMVRDPSAGRRAMLARMSRDPAGYARWYLSKPYLLWDWEIRIGAGDIYTQTVERSPLDRNPTLRLMTSITRGLNPVLFLLAAGFSLLALWRRDASAMVGLAFLYVTAVHVVFQADPRYAIAYRGMELLLAVGGLAVLVSAIRERSGRRGKASGVAGRALGQPELIHVPVGVEAIEQATAPEVEPAS